ncbi:MAG: hypothetical protein SNF33_08270 [Candidatus Algichlamydia australiensis]|nr:hypothetical protein [Chlamydiales bacterium]
MTEFKVGTLSDGRILFVEFTDKRGKALPTTAEKTQQLAQEFFTNERLDHFEWSLDENGRYQSDSKSEIDCKLLAARNETPAKVSSTDEAPETPDTSDADESTPPSTPVAKEATTIDLPANQFNIDTLTIDETVGDGNCAFHSILGSPNSDGKYEYQPLSGKSIRQEFLDRFEAVEKKKNEPISAIRWDSFEKVLHTEFENFLHNSLTDARSSSQDLLLEKNRKGLERALKAHNSNQTEKNKQKVNKEFRIAWKRAVLAPEYYLSENELGLLGRLYDKPLTLVYKNPHDDTFLLNEINPGRADNQIFIHHNGNHYEHCNRTEIKKIIPPEKFYPLNEPWKIPPPKDGSVSGDIPKKPASAPPTPTQERSLGEIYKRNKAEKKHYKELLKVHIKKNPKHPLAKLYHALEKDLSNYHGVTSLQGFRTTYASTRHFVNEEDKVGHIDELGVHLLDRLLTHEESFATSEEFYKYIGSYGRI